MTQVRKLFHLWIFIFRIRDVESVHFLLDVKLTDAGGDGWVGAVGGQEVPVLCVRVGVILGVYIKTGLDTVDGEDDTNKPEDNPEESEKKCEAHCNFFITMENKAAENNYVLLFFPYNEAFY